MTTIFNCADCRKAIKENSREHDDCWTDMEKDDDLWYCADCKDAHMDEEDEEVVVGSVCGECGVSTQGRKIRSLWNNTLCEECGEESDDEDDDEDRFVCGVCGKTEPKDVEWDVGASEDFDGNVICPDCEAP
jgi:ribosomal protein S27AE